jgi:CheY-like chemotaxis protein
VPIPNGRYVKLSIEDTGSGIEEQNLKKIFDPFFSTRSGSSGIGLASAYSIVKRHYGHIDVKSKPGEGTTFTIYLPATRSINVKRGREVKEEKKRGKIRIMIVDDDEMILKSTGKLLKLMGYYVDTVLNGETGIKILKENLSNNNPFDLVILDLVIPGGMGGVEILQQLREIDPDIKAVVSSGYSDEEVLGNYGEYGFNGIVPKPYKSSELQAEINRVLSEAE